MQFCSQLLYLCEEMSLKCCGSWCVGWMDEPRCLSVSSASCFTIVQTPRLLQCWDENSCVSPSLLVLSWTCEPWRHFPMAPTNKQTTESVSWIDSQSADSTHYRETLTRFPRPTIKHLTQETSGCCLTSGLSHLSVESEAQQQQHIFLLLLLLLLLASARRKITEDDSNKAQSELQGIWTSTNLLSHGHSEERSSMSSSFWWLFLHLVLLFSFLSPFCPKSDSPPSDGMVSHLPASISFEFHVSLNIISRLIMNNESDFINSRTSSSFLKKWRPLLEDSDPRRESACVSCPMGFLRCPFSSSDWTAAIPGET